VLPDTTIDGTFTQNLGAIVLSDRATSTTLSGTVNDLQESTVAGFDNCYALRLITAGVIITGFLKSPISGLNVGGSTFVLENLENSVGNVTITNNGSSSPGNRVSTPTGASVNLAPGHSAIFLYDVDATFWRIIAMT
jgi:hypothetical protein